MPASTVTISRTNNTLGNLEVSFTVGGTATYGVDYTVSGATTFTSSAGSLTIPNNQSSASFTVITTSDSTVEPHETIILTLNSSVAWNISGPGETTISILNDDSVTPPGIIFREPLLLDASLSFNGSNGSTTITDNINNYVTWSATGATISTAQSYSGGSSLFVNASNAHYVSAPFSNAINFNGDFMWECWIYPTTVSGSLRTIMGNALGGSSGTAGYFVSVDNGNLVFRHWVNGSTNATKTGVVANTWQKVTAIKSTNTLEVYLNDVIGTNGSSVGLTPNNGFNIGYVANNSGFASGFLGYIDEVRLFSYQ